MIKVKNKALLADLGLFLMAFIWGSGFVVMKNALDVLSTQNLIFFRFLIASIILAIFNIKRLKKLDKETIKYGIVLGFFLYLGFFFQTKGLEASSAGKSAFLTSIYVAIIPFLSLIVTKQKPSKYNVIAAFTMFVGILLLTIDFKEGLHFNFYDILTMIGSLFFGLHVLFVGIYSKKKDPITLVTLQIIVACGLSFLMILLQGDVNLTIPQSAIPSLLYLGAIGSALTFLLQNVSQKYTSPTHAGIIMSTESVFGTLLGIIFLNEIFTLQMTFGAIIIFIALIIAETKLSFLKKKKIVNES